MAVNDIQPFCPTDTGSNLISVADYILTSDRTSGQKPGIASAKLNNRALRQAAFIASQFAQFISDRTGSDVLDNNNNAALLAIIVDAAGRRHLVTKTANYTLTASDQVVLVDATSGVLSMTLPAASGCTGRVYTIKKIDSSANAVTVVGVLDGETNPTLEDQYDAFNIISNGTDWSII